jgi:hypothetical protein
MTPEDKSRLTMFSEGPNIADRWDAARVLMASKAINSVYESPDFERGWAKTAGDAATLNGVPQALAIDLLVRTSQFVKRLREPAEIALRRALSRRPVALAEVSDSQILPAEAKPAEVRENIAIALQYATGDWLPGYLFESLAREDRSARCRAELAKRISEVEPSVEQWLRELTSSQYLGRLAVTAGNDAAAARLRDLSNALANAIRANRRRLTITPACGKSLAALCGHLVSIRKTDRLPKSLSVAANELSILLEEIISTDLTTFIEAETYLALDSMRRWWSPLPFPDEVRESLAGIRATLIAAITLRARWGQRSDELVQRLNSATGDVHEAKTLLKGIATQNPQLNPQILDWLNGIQRTSPGSGEALSALRAEADQGLIQEIADLVREVYLRADNEESTEDQLAHRILAIAQRHGLIAVGRVGETVEYASVSHETSDGDIPRNPIVTIIIPGVARKRADGTIDYIMRAVVR